MRFKASETGRIELVFVNACDLLQQTFPLPLKWRHFDVRQSSSMLERQTTRTFRCFLGAKKLLLGRAKVC